MKLKNFFIVLLLTYSHLSLAALPIAVEGQSLPTLAPMLERVQDSVVNISTESEVRVRRRIDPFFDDPLFRRFFDIPRQYNNQPRTRKRQGLGSGVVIDSKQGLIITNSHVIDKADTITVTLRDGREAKAELIGQDKDSDVALVKIKLDKLVAIPLGNSDALRVGDFVVAIGNPFGLRQTVTSGIVSALGRSDLGIENYEDFIQTDASINPGNSGGALVNLRGELVGINTAIVAPSGGNVGIGFSIPINMALQIKQQLAQHGEVKRGRLGIRIQELSNDLADAFEVKQNRGAIITKVEKGSSADKAGIKEGDVVLNANGKDIKKSADLRNLIGLLPVGKMLDMKVQRQGEIKSISVKIENSKQETSVGEQLNPKLEGATFSELNDQHLQKGIDYGVIISEIKIGSAAWYHGLRKGDIIVSVNRKKINKLKEFRSLIKNQALLLHILRGDSALFLLLQ